MWKGSIMLPLQHAAWITYSCPYQDQNAVVFTLNWSLTVLLLHLSNVSLNLSDTWQRGHGLQINCHNLDLFTLVFSTETERKRVKAAIKSTKFHLIISVYVVYRLWCTTDQVHFHVTDRSLRLSTWLQLPGAAHRSTARLTPAGRTSTVIWI